MQAIHIHCCPLASHFEYLDCRTDRYAESALLLAVDAASVLIHQSPFRIRHGYFANQGKQSIDGLEFNPGNNLGLDPTIVGPSPRLFDVTLTYHSTDFQIVHGFVARVVPTSHGQINFRTSPQHTWRYMEECC